MAEALRGANRVTLFRLFAIGTIRRGRHSTGIAVAWFMTADGEAGRPSRGDANIPGHLLQ